MSRHNRKRKVIPKDKQINKLHSINCMIVIIMAIVLTITVGYSSFSASFEVDNIVAYMRAQADIRITDFSMVSSTSGATSNYEEFSVSSFISSINLPDSDSQVTYDIEILNIGNVEMGIIDIVGLPSNLTYELNNYVLGRLLCDDSDPTECTLGSRTTVRITIKYKNGMYDSSNTTFPIEVGLTFDEIDYVARIGSNYYTKLQLAVNNVPKNNTATSIVLLKDVAEYVEVSASQNIVFDLSGITLSNSGNSPIFENYGAITITNGLIYTTASQGAINVNAGGSLVMSGGSIVSTNFSGVNNVSGKMFIGTKDGSVDTSTPIIIGKEYGLLNSATFKFYDGTIKGITGAISGSVSEVEDNVTITRTIEQIDGVTYNIAYLS